MESDNVTMCYIMKTHFILNRTYDSLKNAEDIHYIRYTLHTRERLPKSQNKFVIYGKMSNKQPSHAKNHRNW